MADCIYIDIEIVEPILLSLELEPVYYVGMALAGPQGIQGEQGDQGDAWTGGIGTKSSSVDAGELWETSIDDDYLYICVQAGTAGNAIWKKTVLFAT